MDLEEIRRRVTRRGPALRTEGLELTSGVLVPLVDRGDGLRLLFEIRGRRLVRQPGEICFPGGMIEASDASPQAAALRECCEELGVNQGDVEVLGPLDPFVSGSHVLIHPFLGRLRAEAELQPDEREIESLLEIPLAFFLETEPETHPVEVRLRPLPGFPLHRVPARYASEWGRKQLTVYFYQFEGHTIWGLSARVVVDLVGRLREPGGGKE